MDIKTENRRWRIKRINELSKAGNTISEIARILMISERTVSYYFIKHKADILDEEFEVYSTVRPKAKNKNVNYDNLIYFYYLEPKYCWCCGVNESIDICDNCIKEFPIVKISPEVIENFKQGKVGKINLDKYDASI